jgi:serine/threonine-protein kinase
VASPLPAPPAKKSGPNLALMGGGAVAVLALLGGGAYFMLGGHSAPPAATQTPATQTPATQVVTPPPPVLTAAQRQAAEQAALGALPCTLIGASDHGSSATFTGLAGAGAPQAALTQALGSVPTPAMVSNQITTLDGPYCSALDTVRPYAAFFPQAGQSLGLALASGTGPLHDGDLITVDETMPASFGGYIETDYFQSDGSVFHLYPTPTDAQTQFGASATKVLGDPTHGGASWQVSAPYGTDLIVSIASSVPLFTALRTQDENASDYLPALRTALQNAASGGAKIAISAIPVVTLPKTGN